MDQLNNTFLALGDRCKSDMPAPIRTIEKTMFNVEEIDAIHFGGEVSCNCFSNSSLILPSPNGIAVCSCSISAIPVNARHPPKSERPPTMMQQAPTVVGQVTEYCADSVKTDVKTERRFQTTNECLECHI